MNKVSNDKDKKMIESGEISQLIQEYLNIKMMKLLYLTQRHKTHIGCAYLRRHMQKHLKHMMC